MPFNVTLNGGMHTNVDFAGEDNCVVGRAERPIAPGEELFQAYADSTAELIYRYGFVLRNSNGHTIGSSSSCGKEDAVSISLDMLAGACGINAVDFHPDSVTLSDSARTARSLCIAASLAASSPWDGLEWQTTIELQWGGKGTARLVGAALVLMAVFSGTPRVDESVIVADDDDATAASLLAQLCVCDAQSASKLRQVASAAGGDDNDPWPALLASVSRSQALESACNGAREAVSHRLQILRAGLFPETRPEGSRMLREAWRMARQLRRVETRILRDADKWISGNECICASDNNANGASLSALSLA